MLLVQGNNETDAWLHTGLCGRPTSLAFLCFPALVRSTFARISGRLIAKTSPGDPAQSRAVLTRLIARPTSMIPKDANQCHKPVPSTLAEIASQKSCVFHCCSFMFLVTNWMVGIITVLVVCPCSSPLFLCGQETPTGQPQCVSLVQTRLPALAMLELNS